MILYVIQVLLYTAMLWLIYVVMLRNTTQHGFNRAYLLFASIIPFILPLVLLPQQYRYQVETPFLNMQLPEVIVGGRVAETSTSALNRMDILLYVYVGVAIVLLSVNAWRVYRLFSVVKSSERITEDKYTLLLNTDYGPGSWGRYIFLPDDKQDATIITHEKAHVDMRHTWDIMFLSTLQALAWPNLFIHLIRKEITQVHEFQADSRVNMDGDDYSKMLLASVFNTCTLPLSHSFIIHPVKRRIMMFHNRTRPRKSIQILTVMSIVMLLGGVVVMQSCQTKQADVKPELVTDYNRLSKHPECTQDLMQFMMNNVKYPQEAKDQNIEGRIAVKFIIDENGKATDAKVLNKDPNPLLADAAMTAMKNMPDWIPGEKDGRKVRCEYVLPFVFKLDSDDKPQEQAEAAPVSRTNINNSNDRRGRVAH